jgi:trigger factor
MEEVKKQATINASELIYQREMDSIREDHERSLRNQRLDMDTYLRFVGQTEEEWQEHLRPQAEDRLATVLVMRKLAEQEELEVEDDEIDAEIDRLMENSAEETAESLRRVLSSEDSRESIRSSLMNRKILARLVEIASSEDDPGEDVVEPSGEPAGEPAPDEAVASPDESPESTDGETAASREESDD